MVGRAVVRIGRVKDGHGIKGELFISLFAGEAAWLHQLETLTLCDPATEPGSPESARTAKKFKLKSARVHKKGLIVKTEELRDRNEAEALIGWLMELPEDLLVSKPGEAIYLREIQGFQVFTKTDGEVGLIESFATNGAQDLLVVRTARGVVEIPFVDAFVERIDYQAKVIHMSLPEGLLDHELLDNE